MELYLLVQKEIAVLKIRDQGHDIDSVQVGYHHDLGQILVKALDTLLRKNIIGIASVSSFTLESPLGSDSTAYRIGQSFIEALKTPIQIINKRAQG